MHQFLLLELFIIGIPSVLLALEPNNERIKGSFLETALARSFPNALALVAPVFILMIIEKFIPTFNLDSRNSISMAVITLVGFINLLTLCTPYTKWRAMVVSLSAVLLSGAITVSVLFLGDLFKFKPILNNIFLFVIMMTLGIFIAIIMQIFRGKIEKFIYRGMRRKEQRKKELEELYANNKTDLT